MKWLLTLLMGLAMAWVILAFIGPRRRVSYYVQAPVQPTLLTDLDKIMEAVGLKPSNSPVESVADVAIMMSAPAPSPSVADMASEPPMDTTDEVTSHPQSSSPADQDMSSIPQPASPAPGPAPVLE